MAKVVIGDYEASVYPERGGYTVAVSLGLGPDGKRNRIKRKGRTKKAAIQNARKAINDLEKGLELDKDYTVKDCVLDFLEYGLQGRSENTLRTYKSIATNNIICKIGYIKLKELKAKHVEEWLAKLALELSTETLGRALNILTRAIRRAQRDDKVERNVAEIVDLPEGQIGRPSKSFTLEQAVKLLAVAQEPKWRIGPYVALCLLTGIRTEEARALKWTDVDLEKGVVYVLRAERHRGETKTKKSRRGFAIAKVAVGWLISHKARQNAERLEAGEVWQENNLIFCHEDGSPFNVDQVERAFRRITVAAGLGDDWVPRELRHTFVSLLSNHAEVAIEKISDLVGHSTTATTETVYRHELRPVIADGAQAMDKIIRFKTA
ncbi:site-specific integrase [Nonomuraea sp. B19D2]|uniref:site-specific integrase n=1 Tax=Nonomuraea sp. B19D2 TaxID=3159561 RepID=UPI0032DB8612